MLTNEQKREIEQEILRFKSPRDARQDFKWQDDKVSFSGSLSIDSNATLNADALTTVGGYISIDSNATLNADALTTVVGPLYIYSNATLNADALTTVGGYLSIYSNATLNAEKLINRDFTKGMKNGELRHGLLKADGIVSVVSRTRKAGEFTLHYAPYPLVVATKDGKVFAHGKTAKEAIEDLTFKEVKADPEYFRGLTLDSVVSYENAIILYRVATGACREGTRMFLEQTKPEKRDYTIREIIEKTKGQYGWERLAGFFEATK